MNKNLSIAEEVQTRLERKNQIAIRHGLPPIGARMVSKHGIEWVVDGHLFAPDLASHVRDGGALKKQDPRDLFPAVVPLNLSPRLRDFYMETDRCTSKHLMMLDTVPLLRPQQAKANVHYISFNRDPTRYLFYLDMANLHETILAHEIAHLWIDLTEGIEDYYVMCDVSDPGKVYQFEYVNSFVIDFWVNDIIRERGFDMSIIDEQERQAVLLYAQAVTKGYWPVKKREAAFMALPIAAILLQREKGSGNNDNDLNEALILLEKNLADVYRLARRLAAVINTYGYADQKSSESARAECLQLSFEFTNDQFIPGVELTHKKVIQPDCDKIPHFLPGLSVPAKLEIGRALARHKMSGSVQMCFSLNPSGQVQVKFIDVAGTWTPPTVLRHTMCIPDYGLPMPFAHKPTTPYELRPSVMKPRALVPQLFQGSRAPSSVPIVQSLSTPMPPAWSGSAVPDFVNRNYLPGLALSLAQTRLRQMEGKQNMDTNLYRYTGNNPVNNIDPSGLDYTEAYDAVLRHRNNINAAAQKVGIQPELLAGVVWLENYAGGVTGWHGLNDLESVRRFVMENRMASIGIASMQLDPNDIKGCGTWQGRRDYVNWFRKSIDYQMFRAAVHLKTRAKRSGRFPNRFGNLTPYEMSIIATEYNQKYRNTPLKSAKPSPYGRDFLRFLPDIHRALQGTPMPKKNPPAWRWLLPSLP